MNKLVSMRYKKLVGNRNHWLTVIAFEEQKDSNMHLRVECFCGRKAWFSIEQWDGKRFKHCPRCTEVFKRTMYRAKLERSEQRAINEARQKIRDKEKAARAESRLRAYERRIDEQLEKEMSYDPGW